MATALRRKPRVLPALFADLLAHPTGPAAQILAANYPRLISTVGTLITAHVQAGRLRPYPLPVLVQLMVSPLVTHLLLRPVEQDVFGSDLPTVEDACDLFADAFLRAVLTDPHRPVGNGRAWLPPGSCPAYRHQIALHPSSAYRLSHAGPTRCQHSEVPKTRCPPVRSS